MGPDSCPLPLPAPSSVWTWNFYYPKTGWWSKLSFPSERLLSFLNLHRRTVYTLNSLTGSLNYGLMIPFTIDYKHGQIDEKPSTTTSSACSILSARILTKKDLRVHQNLPQEQIFTFSPAMAETDNRLVVATHSFQNRWSGKPQRPMRIKIAMSKWSTCIECAYE